MQSVHDSQTTTNRFGTSWLLCSPHGPSQESNASIPTPLLAAACLLERPSRRLGRNHTNHMIRMIFRLPVGAGDQDKTSVLGWLLSTRTCGITVPGALAVEVPNASTSSMFPAICLLEPAQLPTLTPQLGPGSVGAHFPSTQVKCLAPVDKMSLVEFCTYSVTSDRPLQCLFDILHCRLHVFLCGQVPTSLTIDIHLPKDCAEVIRRRLNLVVFEFEIDLLDLRIEVASIDTETMSSTLHRIYS